ncbi:MAG: hypothetical protein LBQ83_05415 [Candidatus Margulisbacteria bacterium]|jgi:hypothetical protein|nr:hypothetical protein [Candidatus Margulisiibacteriota bacterium]
MEQIAVLLPLIIQFLLAVFLFVLLLISWQIFRVVRDAAAIIKRVEVLTDVAGWLRLWKRIQNKR